jgi:hypothetical protein
MLTDEQKENLVELLQEGKTYKYAAAEVLTTPSQIAKERKKDPVFAAKCDEARKFGFDILADSLLDIPDCNVDVQRARLLSDNIKWLLARRASASYGDRMQVEHKHTVDLRGALSQAKERAGLRDVTPTPSLPDSSEADESSIIPATYVHHQSDTESDEWE